MTTKSPIPGWLKPVNRAFVGMSRLGVRVGDMRMLSVPGRVSGRLRTTPVSPFTVDGQLYVASAFEGDWVRNVRAAGWAYLSAGRRRQRVQLVEVPVSERGRILAQFPTQVPTGVDFYLRAGAVEGRTPADFAKAGPRCPVFRVDPAD